MQTGGDFDPTALWRRPLTGWPLALPRCFMTRPLDGPRRGSTLRKLQHLRHVRFGSFALAGKADIDRWLVFSSCQRWALLSARSDCQSNCWC
jgi:hypothetical protein